MQNSNSNIGGLNLTQSSETNENQVSRLSTNQTRVSNIEVDLNDEKFEI